MAPAHALPARALQFPRDYGSHPELQTEWWYITGQLQANSQPWGFQITFFRSRVPTTQALQSPLAARQLLFAHAALSDLRQGRMLHDQRMARAGLGLAEASESDTHVHIGNWSLRREPIAFGKPEFEGSRYLIEAPGKDFALHLQCDTRQPVLLQGKDGLSRKGPDAEQASYYYSQPQMVVRGHISVQGQRLEIQASDGNSLSLLNRAWLDHESSAALLHREAEGWDWLGMNLQDGSALTAFQLRRPDGSALWTGGSWRSPPAAGQAWTSRSFTQGELRFTPLRHWTSPLSKARYPTAWKLDTPEGAFEVRALADNQELDSRASTGAIYWEGLSELRRLRVDGSSEPVGRGYLEMTGYANALKL